MKYKHHTLQFKAEAILRYEQGTVSRANLAKELEISESTFDYWMQFRDKILQQYYSYCKDSSEDGSVSIVVRNQDKVKTVLIEEEPMPRKVSGSDLVKENKDLRDKVSYMEDELAYYKALMEVMGLNPSEVQKKTASLRSGRPQEKEESDM